MRERIIIIGGVNHGKVIRGHPDTVGMVFAVDGPAGRVGVAVKPLVPAANFLPEFLGVADVPSHYVVAPYTPDEDVLPMLSRALSGLLARSNR
jgi:hypothetical protein